MKIRTRLNLIADQQLFKGHSLRTGPSTLDVVQKLTRDQIVAHLAKLRETSRLVLVIVGDVNPAGVVDTAKTALANVPGQISTSFA
jgi:predicted Zn-dependent peptidase